MRRDRGSAPNAAPSSARRAASASGARKPPAPPAAVPRPSSAAERRQLTVMFCDLVGSTALSTRLDPEDLRDVIAAYHKCAAAVVARFGGFVAKYMGDGVLIYFGYPEANEADAENAVRTALAMIEAVARSRLAASTRSASASPPGSSWSANWSAPAKRRSATSSARRRTSPPGCNRRPRPTPW